MYLLTSKVELKAGTEGVSKLFASPAAAAAENFQNWSLLYWTPMREETMGKALWKGLSAPVVISSW